MRNIFLAFSLVTLSFSCFSQNEIIKFTFYNEYKGDPRVTIQIELRKSNNEVKLNLKLSPNEGESNHQFKSLDSIINILDFEKICNEINRFETMNMKNDNYERVIKQYCEIEYISENRKLKFKNNTQGFSVDERDRMLFITICDDIVRIAGLNPEEYIVTF